MYLNFSSLSGLEGGGDKDQSRPKHIKGPGKNDRYSFLIESVHIPGNDRAFDFRKAFTPPLPGGITWGIALVSIRNHCYGEKSLRTDKYLK